MYYSATRDRDILTNPDYNSCDMTREIARFYQSLAKYNSTKGRYDINSKWHLPYIKAKLSRNVK